MILQNQQSGLILLIDGNRQIAEVVWSYLDQRGYSVDYAADGMTGLNLATPNRYDALPNRYDAIVMDQCLPGMDGLEVCRKLRRAARKACPVLMLISCDTLEDKLAGLDAGADAYIVKPFEVRELDARLFALIRRDRHQVSNEKITVGDMTLDPETLQLTRAGRALPVMPIEMKLLVILMRESPRVVSRQDIERELWGDALPDSDALRSHIYNLRKVIDRPFDRPLLHTLYSTGYRIAELNHPKAVNEAVATPLAAPEFDCVRLRTDAGMNIGHIDSYRSAEQSKLESLTAEG